MNANPNILWISLASFLTRWIGDRKQQWNLTRDAAEVVEVTKEDRAEYLKYLVSRLRKDEKRYLGFICLDSTDAQQSRLLFETLLPEFRLAGYTTTVAHESDYFCNRGYYYGNVLKFYLIEVNENV